MSFFLGWESEIARGVVMTLVVAFISLFFGLIIGVSVASAKQAKSRILRFLGNTYTTVIRGTPELLVIFFAYFGSTMLASYLVSAWVGEDEYVEVPTIVACVFSLSIIFGGYAAESIRGAMLALPKGQIEAAYAYGFSRYQCFMVVKLPLIWRYALPALGNNWLSLIKSTSLISLVGLEELMRMSSIAAGETQHYFRFYVIAAALYLILTLINVVILEVLERHSRRSEKAAM
ncbi:ABC transporter permease [Zophobihabitans entericus]|uniref:ABC transporter permease subunit n=1 Tax=Zophobihabitans entericus TaxID=1635327 RepID=A0A6G9I994_9GAMM|nr:ABC transporter permease subunit [Zophobihabitans entericus]QIQ20402.1 ABC transporter permease subunit [Zophobihabitans entericus]